MPKTFIASTLTLALIGIGLTFSTHVFAQQKIFQNQTVAPATVSTSTPTISPTDSATSADQPVAPIQPVAPTAQPNSNDVPAITHLPEIPEKPVPHVILAPSIPVRLIIPAIKLNTAIQQVGIDASGNMDVPSGATNNVGWYKDGAMPGAMGSAVLDAHVFAAFSHLNQLSVGSDIYVQNNNGSTLHFKVTETDTYKLADVPLQRLFNANDGKHLNLITCAGQLTPDHSTYDHRLIIYATLVE